MENTKYSSFHLLDSLVNCFTTIINHKFRSFLTLLGILIGVMAVVTMFSVVFGMKTFIKDGMEKMGWNNSIIVVPGKTQRFSRRRFRFRNMNRSAKPFTINDYYFLKGQVDANESYAVSVDTWKNFKFEGKREWIQVKGVTNGFFRSKTYKIAEGRNFSNFEEKFGENVCVVGPRFVKKYLPGKDNVLGEVVTVDRNRYEIIGVLIDEDLDNNMFNMNNWDRRRELESIYLPLMTGSKLYKTQKQIDFIYFQSYSQEDFYDVKNRINQLMLAKHQMAHDFSFQEVGEEMVKVQETINEMMKKWNMALTAIATISLIVGGIGLFSTLLISISERMTEIGVRKSVGATEFNIFFSFVVESIVLALLGATFGILLSSGLVLSVGAAVDVSFPVPVQGILLGLSFAFIVGLLSGIYPAIKAAKIDPIRAIFYFD